MINGVEIVPLSQIADERGKIMHMLRSDDPHFEKFGEILRTFQENISYSVVCGIKALP